MNSQIISVAYSVYTNKGAFALLLGSGISRKSGIPTGWDITLSLIAQIAILEKQDAGANLEKWYSEYFGKEADYSDILEKLTNTQEERLNLLRPFIEPSAEELEEGLKTPTKAHKQIARLVKEGYVKVIVTTNFDRLLENALKELGIEPTVITNAEHVENSIPLIHSNITIIKINGDYLDTKFLNIKSELENYDDRLANVLKFIFENFGLITCGWSAKWDIALVNILKSANKFRYSNYFTFLGRADDDLKDLNSFRKGQLVEINDADSFFTEIVEGVEALENNNKHPLTNQIVLQRLKKYIVKEEYIISLHDLLRDITDELLLRLAATNFNIVPDLESMKGIKNQYLSQLDTMIIVLANGSYWAKPYQYNVLLSSLRLVTSASDKNHTFSYAVWGKMIYLPALVLKYVCGISCVASGNFELLSNMSSMQVQTKYKLELLVKLTEPSQVIEKDHLNQIEGTGYLVPMSELLFRYLRPFFQEMIPIDSDYESIFNYYEFINSLAYEKHSERGWYPLGRFAYGDKSISEDIMKRAEKEGADFELVKGKLFTSHDDLKQSIDKFNEFFNSVRHYYY